MGPYENRNGDVRLAKQRNYYWRRGRKSAQGTPRCRTKCPVTRAFPRSSLPHCTVRCHGNALHLYHDPLKVILDQVLPSSIWPRKHFALGQVLNTESDRFENLSRHRRPSLRFFVVFVRCSSLMLGSYLTLPHDHFPAHFFLVYSVIVTPFS